MLFVAVVALGMLMFRAADDLGALPGPGTEQAAVEGSDPCVPAMFRSCRGEKPPLDRSTLWFDHLDWVKPYGACVQNSVTNDFRAGAPVLSPTVSHDCAPHIHRGKAYSLKIDLAAEGRDCWVDARHFLSSKGYGHTGPVSRYSAPAAEFAHGICGPPPAYHVTLSDFDMPVY